MINLQNLESDDGFFEIEYRQFKEIDLQNLRDGITLHIVSDDFPESYISSDGKYHEVQIEIDVSQYGEEKIDLRATNILQVVKELKTQKTPMAEQDIYLHNGKTIVHWRYMEPKTVSSYTLLNNIKTAVDYMMSKTSNSVA